jgi:hypothetical protein
MEGGKLGERYGRVCDAWRRTARPQHVVVNAERIDYLEVSGGADETRTRDLRRDRPAF